MSFLKKLTALKSPLKLKLHFEHFFSLQPHQPTNFRKIDASFLDFQIWKYNIEIFLNVISFRFHLAWKEFSKKVLSVFQKVKKTGLDLFSSLKWEERSLYSHKKVLIEKAEIVKTYILHSNKNFQKLLKNCRPKMMCWICKMFNLY